MQQTPKLVFFLYSLLVIYGNSYCVYLTFFFFLITFHIFAQYHYPSSQVEIYENAGGEWKLACQASPGRLEGYEEFFGGQGTQDSSCIASVQCKVSQTGICTLSCAYINQTLRILGYAEFADVSTNFSNLESFLLQIGAKEAIIPVENPSKLKENDVKIRDVLKGADVHLEFQKPKTFKADELPEKLRFLVREGGNLQEVVEMKECSEALAAAVTYLSLAADSCNEQQFTLVHEDLTKFMKLDLAAVRALNMFDDEMDMAHRNKGSLLSFLDECHSPMGKRQLKMWLTQPLLDLVQIKRRQDLVQVFMDDAMLRDALTRSVLTKVQTFLSSSPLPNFPIHILNFFAIFQRFWVRNPYTTSQ